MSASMLDLDGLWEFFYSPQALSPDPESLPAEAAFTGHMVTPGYWDDHYNLFDEEDFFGLTARFNPDYRPPHFPCGRTLTPHASSSFLIGTGYYRRMLPPLFAERAPIVSDCVELNLRRGQFAAFRLDQPDEAPKRFSDKITNHLYRR